MAADLLNNAPVWRIPAIQGDVEAFIHLLAQDPSILHHSDRLGVTPLIRASAWGHVGLVTYLIQQGAALNQVDSTGATALFLACSNGHVEVVKALLASGANPSISGWKDSTSLLMEASYEGHVDIIQCLLEHQGVSTTILDERNEELETSLHIAVKKGQVQVVKVLLVAGANPYLKDEDGKLAIDWISSSLSQSTTTTTITSSSGNSSPRSRSEAEKQRKQECYHILKEVMAEPERRESLQRIWLVQELVAYAYHEEEGKGVLEQQQQQQQQEKERGVDQGGGQGQQRQQQQEVEEGQEGVCPSSSRPATTASEEKEDGGATISRSSATTREAVVACFLKGRMERGEALPRLEIDYTSGPSFMEVDDEEGYGGEDGKGRREGEGWNAEEGDCLACEEGAAGKVMEEILYGGLPEDLFVELIKLMQMRWNH